MSCNETEIENFDVLIINAKIVDVENNQIIENQFIGINSDTIRMVGKMESKDEYSATELIDAENKFLMPGLWDNHVHFRGGDSLVAENKDFLAMFLSYGITSVRDAGGDITPSLMEWKEQIANKRLAGPTIFTSGPKLDGKRPAWPGSIKVTNKQEINNALDSLEKLHVDYVKMYDGSLTPENYYGIIQEAQKRKLKTTGHMPITANFLKAIDFGLDGAEHMYYPIKACSPLADSLGNLDRGYGIMDELVDSYDENLADSVFNIMSDQKVSITPTLHIMKTLANILDTDHSQDVALKHIGKGIQETYKGRIEGAKRARESGSEMREKVEGLGVKMIKPMQEAGVNILAGSDCGAFNSFIYPGESLHAELEELVNAGLTPQQALKTSMINGPKFFDLENFYGSIEKGKVADLIFLEANPLENIRNTRTVLKTLKNERLF
ncbi:amidohydrolase family protein [Gramella sp. AN32]|nr:amidohydrolase family protein [Gramella sp. AN32]